MNPETTKPGPRITPTPELPKNPAAGAAKAAVLNHSVMACGPTTDAPVALGRVARPSLPIGVRAFLYENGMMMDLNALIQPDTSLYLTNGGGINDSGEIIGTAFDANSGLLVAFLAVPAYGGASEAVSSKAHPEGSSLKVVPENLRKQQTGFSRLAFGEATK